MTGASRGLGAAIAVAFAEAGGDVVIAARSESDLAQVAERIRAERWGPRTLDVDVIVCDDVVSDDPDLTLPHPRAHLRAFVLRPWLDVDPDAVLGGVPVRDHLAALSPADRDGVRRVDAVR